jgi:hypothetical protein
MTKDVATGPLAVCHETVALAPFVDWAATLVGGFGDPVAPAGMGVSMVAETHADSATRTAAKPTRACISNPQTPDGGTISRTNRGG